jgi:AcrR family transcriptional regulator
MRHKSDARRQAILSAAEEMFCRAGFEATSMTAIAVAANSSKATVYAYFESKQALFLEMLLEAGRTHAEGALDELALTPDMAAGLTRFGFRYLVFLSAPRSLALLRLAIAEGSRSGLGRQFYQGGPGRFITELTRMLACHIDAGALKSGDPALMASHLKALIECAMPERCLLDELYQPDPASLWAQASCAVTAFVRCYAPSPLPGSAAA